MIKIIRIIRGHIITILSTTSATILSLDLVGMADGLRHFAHDYLGPRGAQKVGVALFALIAVRSVFFTWNMRRQLNAVGINYQPGVGVAARPGDIGFAGGTNPAGVSGGGESRAAEAGNGAAETGGGELKAGGGVGASEGGGR